MSGKSLDLIAENIAQLKTLFPEAVTEGKIDFEVLKNLLGGEIEKRQTYYKFTWNGKEEARAYARIPSMGTLRPCEEDSSGKDGTPGKFDSENLYIEGDNLEVLKLLQGPYHKRVKMIYIDPPYNTGKDFVYPDNFRDSIGNYKVLTGQTDAEGASTRANPETSGRYHTDWLNMMYPRLILARNLLADDGIIVISMDENELTNTVNICNDIFGEENCLNSIVWDKRNPKGDARGIAQQHEYLVFYAKNFDVFVSANYFFRKKEHGQMMLDKAASLVKKYGAGSEEASEQYREWVSSHKNDFSGGELAYCFLDEQGQVYRPVSMAWPNKKKAPDEYFIPLVHPITKKPCPIPERGWRNPPETMSELLAKGQILFGNDETTQPQRKYLLSENLREPVPSLLYFGGSDTALDLPFDNPKPLYVLQRIIDCILKPGEVILDFFSGSASTAHAVMQLNAEDGGNRKYIMVQLPEICEEGSAAAKAGYKNICEIGKERIRRAAKKIKEENPLLAGDMGFKVFKLDTSNFIPWNPNPDDIELTMRNSVENILIDRTTQDLLYEVLLKCNLPLTLPIAERKYGKNTVYIVGEGALAICLDKTIPQTIAQEIVKLRDEYKPIVPMQVVFRDNGFTDVTKTNALQILKQAGFEEKSVQTI